MLTAIDRLLSEQADLTAVTQFSRAHDCRLPNNREPYYRSLIPFEKPGKGEQYAFEVNLDQCTGCKACVAGCHSLNGLEEEETWRDVGLLLDGSARAPRQQTVTSACHHCADPGCLEGCPVLAYEKDPDTGIVRHLDDQCIGCQYCVLKCPYEVPKYSKHLGIVRKCDMCQSRLAVGEAPACVQSCPTAAISIRIISRKEIHERAQNALFLPDSPDPKITKPSTIYKSTKPLSERARAGDYGSPSVQHAHWPLVFMLVLTQAGIGGLTASLSITARPNSFLLGTLLIQLGLGASILHLGQPFKAWRAFLGWRTSWLSREILVLGALGGIAMAAVASGILPWTSPFLPGLSLFAIITGWLGIACSAWVYHDTHRAVWRGFLSFGRFFWTAAAFALLLAGKEQAFLWTLSGKLLFEISLFFRGSLMKSRFDELDRSAHLLRTRLLPLFLTRTGLALCAIAMSCLSFWWPAISLLLAAEILERALFFKAGVGKKMPGQPS